LTIAPAASLTLVSALTVTLLWSRRPQSPQMDDVDDGAY
jgi:hypothetical protein